MLLLAALAGLVPVALVAVTVNVYDVPAVKPETVMGEDAAVPVNPPGLDVAVYPVMAEPPLFVGAVNATEAEDTPAVAVPIVGAPGLPGQFPAPTACITACSVQIPE